MFTESKETNVLVQVLTLLAKISFTSEELATLHNQITRAMGSKEEFAAEFNLSQSVLSKVIGILRDFGALQEAAEKEAAVQREKHFADIAAAEREQAARKAEFDLSQSPRKVLEDEIREVQAEIDLKDLRIELRRLRLELEKQ